MYRLVTAALIGFFALGATAASAGAISVTNANFEDAYALPSGGTEYGYFGAGFAGWQSSGYAGTWAGVGGNPAYAAIPGEAGSRFGYVSNGGVAYQTLNYTITGDADLSLSALIGHRADRSLFNGEMGVFAGTLDNVIATLNLSDPGLGQWNVQTLLIDALLTQAYAGQQLGVFFRVAAGGPSVQINFDNIFMTAEELGLVPGPVLQNPIPGAYVLFASAIAAGGFLRRRAKKAEA